MCLKRMMLVGLAAMIVICGCGQNYRDPSAALYVYSVEAEEQRLIRSVRWEETELLLAVTELLNSNNSTAPADIRIENPDYILEMVNKNHYGEVIAPIFIYVWIDENPGHVCFYSPDISAGTASEPKAYGPYDAEGSVSADFLAQVIQ